MKRTNPHPLRIVIALFIVTLALCAIPVAGMEEIILTTAADDTAIHPGAGDSYSRWNTKALVTDVYPYYPCHQTRILASATGPGDVFYLAYYDIQRDALLLVRVDKGKTTTEKVVSSVYSCGASLDINPVTGTPAVSYRASNRTPFFAYKQDGVWTYEMVDSHVAEGYSTSLAFDKAGTPHLAYDDGTSFSNLMYGTRNPNGTWTMEIADHGIGGPLGDAGKNPQLKITDAGVYIAHGDGRKHTSQRFSWKQTGNDWKSVTVDRGWGETGASSIPGDTGHYPSFTMGPGEIPTLIYSDYWTLTLMKTRGTLEDDFFETSVLKDANGGVMIGWDPTYISKDSTGRTGGHLVFSQRWALMYAEISADPDVPPTRGEILAYNTAACTVTSDSAGKPHIFYLDSLYWRVKHAWLA